MEVAGGEERGKRGLVVILVGAPGSGKSTFCDDVMRAASPHRAWVRVCQDNIANGKAGTKLQCLKTATDALNAGKSVFIDRCNLDREQRADFLKLGGSNVDVHAVVLDLPAKLCISRSVKRSGHEGNLQGGKAAAVVNRMLQKKELPQLSEAFSRITLCTNEKDVQDAVNSYSSLGPDDSLPSGSYGKKSGDSKVQLGIMKFMKKLDPPKNVIQDGNSSENLVSKEVGVQKDHNDKKVFNASGDTEAKRSSDDIFLVDDSSNSVNTLAFPSISTSDFQFDHDKASDIIVERVSDFLKRVEDGRLVFVDLSDTSNIFSLVRSKAVEKGVNSKRFLTVVGDITRLFSERNLRCNVIANAANWRLKPGGGGVNAAIFKAAGEALEVATRKCAGTLSPGKSVAVPLPSDSPLGQREGVTHVIHVLGPNMNPQRPNCLKNDYDSGCKILHDAYSSLFENFQSIIRKGSNKYSELESSKAEIISTEGSRRESLNNNLKVKRDSLHEHEENKKSKGNSHAENHLTTNTKAGRTWSPWAQALHKMAMHPEQHKATILEMSDDYIVLNDLYPKAKHHILVLSKQHGLDSLSDVRKENLPLLKEIHSAGLRWAKKFLNDDMNLVFRLGYHSIPSMRQLHLHVISQDFYSLHLKNKKHWNSFTSAFFRDSVDVMEEIDRCGVLTVNPESLLSMELRCHRCRSAHPNVPKLKSHISWCQAPFPSHLLKNGRLVSS